jgi:hypothetical protein
MRKLKASEVAPTREALLARQGGVCALTHYPLPSEKAVLDHDHATGHVRGTVHRGANSLLGKIENNYKRYGMTLPEVIAMGKNLGSYLTKNYGDMPLHPTHKTEDEKRLARNAKARKTRATKKVQE